ncbi:MAG TPA: energy transducer TonB [Alphaproteobacteria bacterium]|nr:energy transducer TonB [Alphaproteobacteria bacterium]
MTPKRSPILLFSLLFLAQFAAASSDDTVEQSLRHLYEGKILFLREPIEKESLRYSADGKSLTKGAGGSWTVYGAIRIDKLELEPTKLSLQGRRYFFIFDDQKLVPIEFKLLKNRKNPPAKPSVKIEINLNHPADSLDRAQATLALVFALNKDDFIKSVSEFWREYLTKHFGYDPSRDYAAEFAWEIKDDAKGPPELVAGVGKCCGEGVKEPKPKYTPNPEFSEAARYEHYQGVLGMLVTVTKEGRIENIRIVKPLGFGLDEKAADVVRSWTFKPATRNGEPVAVRMGVEVDFHLYN